MIRIIRNKELLSDVMQSIGYFVFVSGLFTIALPLIKKNEIDAWPFILLFLSTMAVSYIFTLAYVVRPAIQAYYPQFGLAGLDDELVRLPWYHASNVIFSGLAIIAALAGWYVVRLGMASGA